MLCSADNRRISPELHVFWVLFPYTSVCQNDRNREFGIDGADHVTLDMWRDFKNNMKCRGIKMLLTSNSTLPFKLVFR